MWRSLRLGFREWNRDKFFGFAVLVLLSIGIGANTLMFSFVNTLLLKPLPVRNAQDLVLLEKIRIKQVRPDTSFFYRQFEAVTQLKKIFPAAVAEQEWTDVSFQRFSTGDSMRLLTTQIVSPNYFSELGLRSVVGRVLVEGDATATGEIPVVLSYQFWHSQFAGKRDVVG